MHPCIETIQNIKYRGIANIMNLFLVANWIFLLVIFLAIHWLVVIVLHELEDAALFDEHI